MGLITWCNRFIKTGFYLLFGLVPLLLTPLNYELFEYNKMMAVYFVASFVVASWVVKMIAQKKFEIARTPLDIPIALFVISQLVSSLFSIDPHVSWFGYYSRFNGGMWSVISYVLLYYAYLSNWSNMTNWTNLLKVSLITASLVAIYGVLERMGIDKNLWVQDVQNRVFSTLGQPNWLAAYLVALVPITWAFGLQGIKNQELRIKHWLWFFLSVLFFVVLLFTRSRSGLLGFVVADVVFWGMALRNFIRPPLAEAKNRKGVAFFRIPIILHILFALIIFVNGTGLEKLDRFVTFNGLKNFIRPGLTTQGQALPKTAGPALETGGTESGTIRKYVWQGAINAWNSNWKTRLIGTGTETFAFAFYEHRPAGHNQTSEWDFLYNKAHNEYLNYLATTGVFGLGSYLLFIVSFIIWFTRKFLISNYLISKQAQNSKSQLGQFDQLGIRSITIALFSGWLSILVTNFFGFSVVILQVFLFLFPAIIISQYISKTTFTLKLPLRNIWFPISIGVYVIVKIGSFWYADVLYAQGYRLIRGGQYGQAIPSFTRALALNNAEPTYHDELGSAYATLAVAASQGNNATQAAQLAALAIEENQKSITTSPHNVNFFKTKTKIYYTLSALEPTFNAKAVEALEQAIPLSPKDPKIFYNLAILVGRDGDAKKAIEYLQKAKLLKPNYRDVYYALWVFYTEEKKPTDAKAILEDYLKKVDPKDKDFLERLK